MGFRRRCYRTEDYTQPTLVTVQNGIKQTVKNRETLEDLTSGAVLIAAYTVESLFTWIQDALDLQAYDISLRADEEYVFVTYIRIDYANDKTVIVAKVSHLPNKFR
jgi:hypothetical protein